MHRRDTPALRTPGRSIEGLSLQSAGAPSRRTCITCAMDEDRLRAAHVGSHAPAEAVAPRPCTSDTALQELERTAVTGLPGHRLSRWATDRVAQQAPKREQLFVPDRFERLRPAGEKALRTIITPVEGALSRLDDRFDDMASAGRGSLLILRGETGVGKSTFLDTVSLFRAGVVTHRIPANADVAAELRALGESAHPRILVSRAVKLLGDSRPRRSRRPFISSTRTSGLMRPATRCSCGRPIPRS